MNRILLFMSITVSTFVIGLWAAKGFPMHAAAAPPPPVQPLPATVDATFGNDKTEEREARRTEQAINDPDNAKRNPMRMETLQAATGFALSPCDAGMKASLVKAATTYAAAYAVWEKCNPMFRNCDPVLERANVMYSSPLDRRVRDALHEAFQQGGIGKDDFPRELQMSVMSLANSQGSAINACTRTTERRPR